MRQPWESQLAKAGCENLRFEAGMRASCCRATFMWPFWIKLAAPAVLGSYLVVKNCRRALAATRLERERHHQAGLQWKWTAFDARPVSARLQALRQDYVTPVRLRPQRACYRRRLLAGARQVIAQRSYFQRPRKREAAGESTEPTKRN